MRPNPNNSKTCVGERGRAAVLSLPRFPAGLRRPCSPLPPCGPGLHSHLREDTALSSPRPQGRMGPGWDQESEHQFRALPPTSQEALGATAPHPFSHSFVHSCLPPSHISGTAGNKTKPVPSACVCCGGEGTDNSDIFYHQPLWRKTERRRGAGVG